MQRTKAFSDKGINVTIFVTPYYIQYYNSIIKPIETATKCASICIHKPEYFNPEHPDKIDHWYLSSKEKKELIQLLSSAYDKDPSITNWQQVICTYNYGFYDIDPVDTKCGNISDEDLKDGALSINTPMPNYMEL